MSHLPDQAGESEPMKQPQLLLIDDEPALADFVANAARETGYDPTVASLSGAWPPVWTKKPGTIKAGSAAMPASFKAST